MTFININKEFSDLAKIIHYYNNYIHVANRLKCVSINNIQQIHCFSFEIFTKAVQCQKFDLENEYEAEDTEGR